MKANKFTLKIQLGNDAMSSDLDVSRALVDVAHTLGEYDPVIGERISIRDLNGNTVGEWKYTK